MKKICIYLIDNLLGGETGLYDFLQRSGFKIEDREIYRGDVLVGKMTEGRSFSEHSDLELHIFNDSALERMIDKLQVHGSRPSDLLL